MSINFFCQKTTHSFFKHCEVKVNEQTSMKRQITQYLLGVKTMKPVVFSVLDSLRLYDLKKTL